MSWTSGVCRTGGVDIHYLRTGAGKPPLLALHGLTGAGACWTPLARALEGDFDVVMPDARGHGRSSAPPRDYGCDDHAADVVALVESLGLAAPVLIGHSMGGMTAALAASRLGTALRGLVLIDPTFLGAHRQREVYHSDVAEQHLRLIAMTRDEALAQARLRHPQRSPELVEIVTDARRRTSAAAFDVLRPPNPDYRELASAWRVPILLVAGDDGVVTPATARELQGLNPRIRYEQVSQAGHGLPYDQPDRLAAAVGPFLRSLPSSARTRE